MAVSKHRIIKYRIGAFLLFIMLLFLFLNVSEVLAAGSGDDQTAVSDEKSMDDFYYMDYVIKAYDIHVVVNENNVFNITETITADFKSPKHGIFRKIPFRNTVKRLDGTETENMVRITNLYVNEPYETEKEDEMLMIRIGDADRTVTGEKKYVISYDYNLGRDPLKDCDELYFNLIGTDWETVIGGITFTIEMPKAFDESKLGFAYGYYGSKDSSKLKFGVSGNTISGSLDKVMEPGMAFTVRCELPEGYFTGATLMDTMDYVCFGVPILLLAVCFFIWLKYGKDDMVVETVEFYPPDGMNSLEAGLYYKGTADQVDVTSLLIYLANAGYLSIEEYEIKKTIGKKNSFRIWKEREYDGNNQYEKKFFDGLFKYGRTENGKKVVTADDLTDSFYTTTNSIITMANDKKNTDKLFENSGWWQGLVMLICIAVSWLLIGVPPLYNNMGMGGIGVMIVPLIALCIIMVLLFKGRGKGRARGGSVGKKFVGNLLLILTLIGVSLAIFFIFVFPAARHEPIMMAGFIIGSACVLGMVFFLIFLPKRSDYGNQILGRLLGFRNFLETAEKEQLEQMVFQDPAYFYRILPYTYVLGVSDKWIKKFESINIEAPTWYYAPYPYGYFDPHVFANSVQRTMDTATRSMTSSPSESSGGGSGGFSGGGFSGGGSGGGGGGAW